ncbi:MAG TPA: hypothetical protein QGF58_23150 [Myxococcota bacterium]|nr:hypothetical protein [Myxococcota bacterium]
MASASYSPRIQLQRRLHVAQRAEEALLAHVDPLDGLPVECDGGLEPGKRVLEGLRLAVLGHDRALQRAGLLAELVPVVLWELDLDAQEMVEVVDGLRQVLCGLIEGGNHRAGAREHSKQDRAHATERTRPTSASTIPSSQPQPRVFAEPLADAPA